MKPTVEDFFTLLYSNTPADQVYFWRTINKKLPGNLGVKTFKSANWKTIIKGLSGHNETDDRDFYIYPATFLRPTNPTSGNCAGAGFVWADCDGNSPTWDEPPTITIETSPEHYHFYWKLTSFQSPKTIEAINRPIAYKYNLDRSGWDCSQLLRPPSSYNRKRDNFQSRIVGWYPDNILVPEIQETAGVEEPATVPDIYRILTEVVLTGKTKGLLFDPFTGTDRSKFLYRVACLLIEEGCKTSEILGILQWRDNQPDLKKATTRLDPEDYYKNLEKSARSKLGIPEPGTQKGTALFRTAKNLSGSRELAKEVGEFIVADLLPERGNLLILAKPDKGKTRFALNMMFCLATGTEFIGKKISRPRKVGYVSLDMPDIRVVEILNKQEKAFLQHPDENKFFAFKGSSLDLSIAENQEALSDWIRENELEVIIIDSLLRTTSEASEQGKVGQVMDWINDQHRAFILIAHPRKQQTSGKYVPEDIDSIFGSVVWSASIDTAIVLERVQKHEAKVYQIKDRLGMIPEPINLTVHWDTSTFSAGMPKQTETSDGDSPGGIPV